MRRTEPMSSRSGVSHPLGKFTAKFPPYKGPESTKEILEKKAARLDMSLAEYLRELAIIHAHGVDTLKSLHVSRIEAVAGKGHEGDSNK